MISIININSLRQCLQPLTINARTTCTVFGFVYIKLKLKCCLVPLNRYLNVYHIVCKIIVVSILKVWYEKAMF